MARNVPLFCWGWGIKLFECAKLSSDSISVIFFVLDNHKISQNLI